MSDAVSFVCPHCQAQLSVPGRLAGKRGRCPHCKEKVTVPGGGAAGLVAAPAPPDPHDGAPPDPGGWGGVEPPAPADPQARVSGPAAGAGRGAPAPPGRVAAKSGGIRAGLKWLSGYLTSVLVVSGIWLPYLMTGVFYGGDLPRSVERSLEGVVFVGLIVTGFVGLIGAIAYLFSVSSLLRLPDGVADRNDPRSGPVATIWKVHTLLTIAAAVLLGGLFAVVAVSSRSRAVEPLAAALTLLGGAAGYPIPLLIAGYGVGRRAVVRAAPVARSFVIAGVAYLGLSAGVVGVVVVALVGSAISRAAGEYASGFAFSAWAVSVLVWEVYLLGAVRALRRSLG